MPDLELHNAAIARLERENAALRALLEEALLTPWYGSDAQHKADISRVKRKITAALQNEDGQPNYMLISMEDLRAAQLCDLAGRRLRTGPLADVSIAEAAAAETIARTAIDAERECRIPRS